VKRSNADLAVRDALGAARLEVPNGTPRVTLGVGHHGAQPLSSPTDPRQKGIDQTAETWTRATEQGGSRRHDLRLITRKRGEPW
jgi:hypothetical protein